MESLRDDFNAELEYEQPNRNLYEFAGNLKLDRNKWDNRDLFAGNERKEHILCYSY